jgi:hypothetical protein
MTEPRALTAGDLSRILRVYLRIVEELPADTEAGHLDAEGHVHFARDIARKLRAAREATGDLDRLRRST